MRIAHVRVAFVDWFLAEFWLLETQAALAKAANAALVKLIAKVEVKKSKMSSSEWRRQVEGICNALGREHLSLTAAEDAQPAFARSPMQRRKRRFVEAAIGGLARLLAKPST